MVACSARRSLHNRRPVISPQIRSSFRFPLPILLPNRPTARRLAQILILEPLQRLKPARDRLSSRGTATTIPRHGYVDGFFPKHLCCPKIGRLLSSHSFREPHGTGGFEGTGNEGNGRQPHSIVKGDFNGDGIRDLASANSGDGTVSVLLGAADGSFTQSIQLNVGPDSTFADTLVAANSNRGSRTGIGDGGKVAKR
ncbi:hypothetical protein Mal15_32310 [Stieleria maiorica]|uniref:FG-GAP repeat protein n=2 Tax=Stieleria maiorica TaxID=2795974 RepID=A0A5B9MD21_9BACT|nr:hypothetical protein Mal15_32310 [Stieleria maiorica]